MNDALHAPCTRANLDRAIAMAEPHLLPILKAVRDHSVAMFFVGQRAEPFRRPPDRRPMIGILGDDFDKSVGPGGFHMASVRRLVRSCAAFAVVSSEPQPDVYSTMALTAVATRQNVLIVETRLIHEGEWLALIQKLAPGRPIIIATVEGGHC